MYELRTFPLFFFVWVIADQDSQDMDTDLWSILHNSLLLNSSRVKVYPGDEKKVMSLSCKGLSRHVKNKV